MLAECRTPAPVPTPSTAGALCPSWPSRPCSPLPCGSCPLTRRRCGALFALGCGTLFDEGPKVAFATHLHPHVRMCTHTHAHAHAQTRTHTHTRTPPHTHTVRNRPRHLLHRSHHGARGAALLQAASMDKAPLPRSARVCRTLFGAAGQSSCAGEIASPPAPRVGPSQHLRPPCWAWQPLIAAGRGRLPRHNGQGALAIMLVQRSSCLALNRRMLQAGGCSVLACAIRLHPTHGGARTAGQRGPINPPDRGVKLHRRDCHPTVAQGNAARGAGGRAKPMRGAERGFRGSSKAPRAVGVRARLRRACQLPRLPRARASEACINAHQSARAPVLPAPAPTGARTRALTHSLRHTFIPTQHHHTRLPHTR